jgi:hypothetical protein
MKIQKPITCKANLSWHIYKIRQALIKCTKETPLAQ